MNKIHQVNIRDIGSSVDYPDPQLVVLDMYRVKSIMTKKEVCDFDKDQHKS